MNNEFQKAKKTGERVAKLMQRLSVMDTIVDKIYIDLTEDVDEHDIKTQDAVFDSIFNPYGEFITNVRKEISQYLARRLNTTD